MSYDPTARRPIGRTGLAVSQIGFGCAPFGNLLANVPDSDIRDAVSTALARGLRYFDTAPFYGHGLAEHRLGEALRASERHRVVISTKVGRLLKPTLNPAPTPGPFASTLPFDIVFDYSYDGTMRSIEDSLQRLGLPRIDIALIHDVTPKWRGDALESSYRQAVAGAFPALAKLRAEGVIDAVGVGVNDVDILRRFAQDTDCDCFMLAGRYTLLDTSAMPDLMAICERRKIRILLAAPFHSGILVTGAKLGAKFWYSDAPQDILHRVTQIEQICRAHGIPLQAAALQFPLAHPAIASVVAGFRNSKEVEAALAAAAIPIPAVFWADLKAARLIDEAAPVPPSN